MGIVAAMFWIFFGVFYILYKIGSEELDGGVKGGIIVILIPIAILAVLGGIPYVLSLIFGDDGVIGFWILFLVCWGFFFVKYKREEIEEKKKRDAYFEELSRRVHSEQEKSKGEFNDSP